jgi:hypothetical protein
MAQQVRRTVHPGSVSFKFLPNYSLWKDGLSRMSEFLEADDFTFLVNGESITTTLFEAVLVSPAACDSLRADPTNRTFVICESIDAQDFRSFLEYAKSHEAMEVRQELQKTFLTICRSLENEELALVLLASLHPISISGLSWEENPINISELFTGLCDATVNYCASLFYLYSVEELRLLDRRIIHKLLRSPSLMIVSEDALLQTITELGGDSCEFGGYIDLRFLSEEKRISFIDGLDLGLLTPDIWSNLKLSLQTIGTGEQLGKRFLVTFNSKIIQNPPFIFSDLFAKKWQLLYRGSEDGFRGSDFHRKCDGRRNTLNVILTTNDFIFGGFTPVPWDSGGSYRADSTMKSFLLTVKNARRNKAGNISMSTISNVIYCNGSYGPTFGSAHCIYVSDQCNANTNSYTNLTSEYINDTGIPSQEVFTGQSKFQVKEIEVFEITE